MMQQTLPDGVQQSSAVDLTRFDPSIVLLPTDPMIDEDTLSPLQMDYASMESLVGTPTSTQMAIMEMLNELSVPFIAYAALVAGTK